MHWDCWRWQGVAAWVHRGMCLAEAAGDAETEQYRTLGRLLVFAHICRCMVGM